MKEVRKGTSYYCVCAPITKSLLIFYNDGVNDDEKFCIPVNKHMIYLTSYKISYGSMG